MAESILRELTSADLERIRSLAIRQDYSKGELIFSEGDEPDYIYFIESGRVSVLIKKFTADEEIAVLGPGDCFGEMAVIYNDKRTASVVALEGVVLLRVARDAFIELIRSDRGIADKINSILARRNEELILRESLVDMTGVKGNNLHISIKGDPSLRETTYTRERYESIVDSILPQLEPRLKDLLLNRCIFRVYVGFNNGEVRTSSLFDPFNEEIHQANKLVDGAYLERHFARISYEEKASMLRRLYKAVADDPVFTALPDHFRRIFIRYYENWRPITPEEIVCTISRLTTLRGIPNYYLRNFTISMARDVIRMQFNCDGTHIVSAKDYLHFIDEVL